LIENYDLFGGFQLELGKYTADVYQVDVTVSHGTQGSVDCDSIWERHSSSNLLRYYADNSGTNELDPYEFIDIISDNSTDATIRGYVYKLTDDNGNINWLPFDIANVNAEAKVAYSLLCGEGIVFCDPIIIISSENITLEPEIKIMPNPAKESTTLIIKNIEGNILEINLYNGLGKYIRNVYNAKKIDSELTIESSVKDLPAGIYFYQIKCDDQIHTMKFIKS
jgi:hypothetical protein